MLPSLSAAWFAQVEPVRYTAAALADRVTALPAQPDVSFAHFAGFVNISTDATRRDIFYWFVESQRSPEQDPLLLWTNGGPGCSGLLGKLTEMGPFRSAQNGTALDFMPYAWNREANIIFVEQPVGVGFSISEDPADAVTTDELNARRLARFVDRWLHKFPGFRANDFYLSSESYGGHYVPHTTLAILAHNRAALSDAAVTPISFRGALVGNPYTDPLENAVGMMIAAWGHGLLPTAVYDTWRESCPTTATHMADSYVSYYSSYNLYDYDYAGSYGGSYTYAADAAGGGGSGGGGGGGGAAAEPSEAELVCRSDGYWLFLTYVGADAVVNPYALSWPVCTAYESAAGYMQRFHLFSLLQASEGGGVVGNASSHPMRGLYQPCGEPYMNTYLNRPDVRAALHVDHSRRWAQCDDPIFERYERTSHNAPQQPFWAEILRGTDWHALQMAPLKVLIFSGDDDAICGVHGTQRWVFGLGLNVTSWWQPWFYDDPLYNQQLGGYLTKFEGLHFATVRGAGHEVPAYRPAAAYAMLKAFLDEESTGVGARLAPPSPPPPSPPPFPPTLAPTPPPPVPPPSAPPPPFAPASMFACGGAPVHGSTGNATDLLGNPAPDVLLPFCVASAGRFVFSTCGSDFDTYLRLFAAPSAADAVAAAWPSPELAADVHEPAPSPSPELAGLRLGPQLWECDDCGPCSNRAAVASPLDPGCYTLGIEGYDDSAGEFLLSISCAAGGTLAATPPPSPPAPPPMPPGRAPLPPPLQPPSSPPQPRAPPSPAPPPPPPALPSAAPPTPSSSSPPAPPPQGAPQGCDAALRSPGEAPDSVSAAAAGVPLPTAAAVALCSFVLGAACVLPMLLCCRPCRDQLLERSRMQVKPLSSTLEARSRAVERELAELGSSSQSWAELGSSK